MRKIQTLLTLLALLMLSSTWAVEGILPQGYPETSRLKQSINSGWQYHLGAVPGAKDVKFDDSKWETVHVPHTLKLTDLALDKTPDSKVQETFHREIAWYRRSVTVSKSAEKVFLEFEGAHQVTDLWVNGEHVGQHAIGGYTPFHFDITDYVHPGQNGVALRLDNRRRFDTPPDPGPFDYVKFSGLYRDVYLVETDNLHVTFPWEDFYAGVFVTTPSVDPLNMNATVAVRTTVRNEEAKSRECTLLTRVIDKDGNVVVRMNNQATIAANADYTFNQCSGIEENLHLWSLEDPYLYRVNTLVYDGERQVDCIETRLGIRSLTLNKHDGLLLNGKLVKMVGANRHQHYAYIGDALPNSLHYKDMWQFKQIGYNTVRTAHYPQDNALLDACDELGILVYEEPPTWIGIGDDKWFDNLELAARRMVRNHRNHPSVVIWGAGINHRGYVPRLHYAVKQEDPTRWTASNNSEWTGVQNSGVCDLFTNMDYAGIEDWSGEEYLFAMEGGGGQTSVSKLKSNPMRIGLTAWTAHAYYTFHLKSNTNRMRSGNMDGFRTPSPNLEWYRAEMYDEPIVLIRDTWKAGIQELRVISNCEEVELVVNGKTQDRQGPVKDPRKEYLDSSDFVFEIKDYLAGEVVVNGLIKGEIKASASTRTPEEPVAVHLNLDMADRTLTADGSDIVMAYARVVDKNGTFISDAKMDVRFSVSGPAEIVGDTTIPGANPMRMTRNGSAPALVRAGTMAGTIIVRAEVDGLEVAEASVTSLPFNSNLTVAQAKPIYDLQRVRIDLGAEGQLVQFGWTPWIGKNNSVASLELSDLGGFTITLRTGSDDGITRWLGEMNVKGFHGFAMSEGVCVIDPKGMALEFSGLPQGNYILTTYHHSPSSNTNSMDPNRERLKTLDIRQIPVAQKLIVRSNKESKEVSITSGSVLPQNGPGKSVIRFSVNNDKPVSIKIKDSEGARGVWLNAFELKRALSETMIVSHGEHIGFS